MDPDALANLIAVAQHLNRPAEVINRYLTYVALECRIIIMLSLHG